MLTRTLDRVVRQVHRAVRQRGGGGLTDGDLLEGYIARRDEAAFEELVRRHGPMVLAVCRRILRNQADAEDAFQATFLVLVRKASSIHPPGMVGNFLYGVAHNTALKGQAMKRKRHTKEMTAGTMPRVETGDPHRGVEDLLDGELGALPDKYRVPLVLCELEGRTIKEAARQLAWPEGTVATRLRKGRELLAERLSKQGLPCAGTALAGVLAGGTASASVPASLLGSTLRAALLFAAGEGTKGLISPTVAVLTQSVLKGMLLGKLKLTTALLLFALVAGMLALLPGRVRPVHSAAPPVASARSPADATVEDAAPTDFAANAITVLGAGNVAISAAFSPDGKHVAAGMGNWDRRGRVEVFGVATQKLVWAEDEKRGVFSVGFSPDGNRLAWSGWNGQLCVDQVAPRRSLIRLPLVENNFYLAWSRDRKWLALAGENRTLRLLEASTGREAATLGGDGLFCFCVDFSPDSKLLAAGGGRFLPRGPGSGPNQVNLFDVTTRKQVGKLTGHTQAVLKVAFAPREALIATASADRTVRLWDRKSFKVLHSFAHPMGGVKGLAFSPDGTLLATGCFDGIIRLWDVRERKQVGELEGHPAAVQEVAFAPEGNLLVSVGDRRSVRLWDVKERTLLATLREDPEPSKSPPPQALAVSPDGTRLATGNENGEVHFHDAHSGEVRRTVAAHEEPVTVLAFSPDGKHLATSGPDTLVKVHDAHTGKLLHTLEGHASWVYALTFSPDGKRLASGSYDRTVRLWEPATGKALGTLKGHKATLRALAFSPDGGTLASGGADRQVRLWDVASLGTRAVLKGHEGTVRAVAFAPDGKTVASAGEDGQLCLWDTVKGVLAASSRPGIGELASLAYSAGGRVLLAGSEDGRIALAEGATGTVRRIWAAHAGTVKALALGPGGRELFSLGADGLVKVVRGLPAPLRVFEGHKGPLRAIAFSPDGGYLLSCSGWPEGDRTLRLWDVKTGKHLRLFMTGKYQVQSAAFSPDGKHAAAGEDTGVIHLFEVQTGKEVRQFSGHRESVPQVSFSPDGRWLLSAGADHTVRLWDAGTGDCVRVLEGHTAAARCAIFHPDGKRIVSGGRDCTIRVFDRKTGQLLQTIEHNKEPVEKVALLPDGKRLLSCGGRAMRLWRLGSGEQIRAFSHWFGPTWFALTRDGQRALTTAGDGSTLLWDVESGAVLERFGDHRNWVWSVAIAPDGKTFATGGGGGEKGGKWFRGEDFTIRLWRMPAARAPLR